MKKTFCIILCALLLSCTVFIGCAKHSGVSDYESYAPGEPGGQYSFNDGTSSSDAESAENPADVLAGRMIIRNADLTVQTLEFEEFMRSLNERIVSMGGYVQSNSVDGKSYYGGKSLRYAKMTVRIPAERLDEFLAEVDGLGNVIRSELGLADVTEQYTDSEARLSSLRTEYETLLGLLEKADSLDTILKLQNRLTEVRYNIESYEAKLRKYDNLIAYSTVNMSVSEVERETAVAEESFGEEVGRRFRESLEDVGDGIASFAKWFIGDLPRIIAVLVLIALPVAIALLIVRAIRRRREKRMLKAKEELRKNQTAEAETKEE